MKVLLAKWLTIRDFYDNRLETNFHIFQVYFKAHNRRNIIKQKYIFNVHIFHKDETSSTYTSLLIRMLLAGFEIYYRYCDIRPLFLLAIIYHSFWIHRIENETAIKTDLKIRMIFIVCRDCSYWVFWPETARSVFVVLYSHM